MNKAQNLALVLAAVLASGMGLTGLLPAMAEEENERGEEVEGNNNVAGAQGTGLEGDELEENEEENEESEGGGIGSGLSALVLYGVIAAVLGTIGYTAYKILAGRKKSSVTARS